MFDKSLNKKLEKTKQNANNKVLPKKNLSEQENYHRIINTSRKLVQTRQKILVHLIRVLKNTIAKKKNPNQRK